MIFTRKRACRTIRWEGRLYSLVGNQISFHALENKLHLLGHEEWTTSVSLSIHNVARDILEVNRVGTTNLSSNSLVSPKRTTTEMGTLVFAMERLLKRYREKRGSRGSLATGRDQHTMEAKSDPSTIVILR